MLRTGCLFAVLLGSVSASPFTETLNLVQGENGYEGFEDTSVFSENEFSGGGTDGIFSGTNAQFHDRRALIRVDLSAIPAGSEITDVSLQMRVMMSGENFGDLDFTLHRIEKNWGEGNVVGLSEGGFGNTANTGDATGVSDAHGVGTWDSPGGDADAIPSAIASAGGSGATALWSGGGMVDDVQAWVDGTTPNNGWMIVSAIEGEFKRVKKFYSSEADGFRPALSVTYLPAGTEVPVSAGWMFVGMLMGVGVFRRIRTVESKLLARFDN